MLELGLGIVVLDVGILLQEVCLDVIVVFEGYGWEDCCVLQVFSLSVW